MRPGPLLLLLACGVGACGPEASREGEALEAPDAAFAPADAAIPPTEDAGLPDAGLFDAGLSDAGLPDAGAADGGVRCDGALFVNAGFECGLGEWLVLKGAATLLSSDAWSGSASVELTADSGGEAVLARRAPLAILSQTTLCFAFRARGTVPNVRLEVLTLPSNQGLRFAAPVTPTWTRVPPSMLQVVAPASSEVWLVVRAVGAGAGQRLELDAFEVTRTTGASCSP